MHARRHLLEPRGTGLVAPAPAPGEPARPLRREQALGLLGDPRRGPRRVSACTPTSTTSAWPTCTGPTSRPAATGGHAIVAPAEGIDLPERPEPHHCASIGTASIWRSSTTPPAPGSRRRWTEPDGRAAHLDVVVALPPSHESLNVVIPWRRRAVQLHVEAPGPSRGGRAGGRRPAMGGRRVPTASTRGACSTSAGDGGRRRSPGTGAAGPVVAATTSSASSSAPSGRRAPASPRTA